MYPQIFRRCCLFPYLSPMPHYAINITWFFNHEFYRCKIHQASLHFIIVKSKYLPDHFASHTYDVFSDNNIPLFTGMQNDWRNCSVYLNFQRYLKANKIIKISNWIITMIYRVPSTDIKINKSSFLIGFLSYSELKGIPFWSFGRPWLCDFDARIH